MDYPTLFQPGKIGNMEVKNRIVMSPMITEIAETDGSVSQRMIDYYTDRAKGGAGLIIVEASCVQSPDGKGYIPQLDLNDDKFIPGLSRLVQSIKKYGASTCIQLFHAGPSTHKGITGVEPKSASAISYPPMYEKTAEMTPAELEVTRQCFVDAAIRCQKAGFDSIMLHACHRYLLAAFMSPVWNRRTDEYGGNLQNRARYPAEILKAIKEATDLPVIMRINVGEHDARQFLGVEQETTWEDSIETAKILEAAGADGFHISTWGYGPDFINFIYPQTVGERLPEVAAIKQNVSVPVFAYGRLTADVAEKTLKEGKGDFAAFGRQFLADPYFPQKLQTGKGAIVPHCLHCGKCSPVSMVGIPTTGIKCSINTRCGHEAEFEYPPPKTSNPKNIIVVGGGPGGMETARVAAGRGHHVSLYEKQQELGGQTLAGDKAHGKKNMAHLSEYLIEATTECGADVKTGIEITKQQILEQNPDAVVIATGAQAIVPKIEGLDPSKTVSAFDAITNVDKTGKQVIVIGGGMIGLEAAEVLGASGRKVTVIEVLPQIGNKMVPIEIPLVMAELNKHSVDIYTGVVSQKVTDEGMRIVDGQGNKHLIEADTLVLAAGTQPLDDLFQELEGEVPELFRIGDAREPRWIIDAISEGFKTAYYL